MPDPTPESLEIGRFTIMRGDAVMPRDDGEVVYWSDVERLLAARDARVAELELENAELHVKVDALKFRLLHGGGAYRG